LFYVDLGLQRSFFK